MIAAVERALAPLDVARGLVLRSLARIRPLRRTMAARKTRIPVLLSLHAVVAFPIALLAPSLSLTLAPILFGAPHVASDVRYLVMRRALPRWWLGAICAFAATLFALRVLVEARLLRGNPILVENIVGSASILLGALGGAVLGGWRRAAPAALAMATALATGALLAPHLFRLGLLHGHNLLAIPIWLLLFRRAHRLTWLPVGLILIGAGLLASRMLLGVTVHHGVLSLFGLHLFAAADWIAPGLSDDWAVAVTTCFAFLQSVHYAIWLVCIPQDDARAERTTTFRMSWRGLVRDFTLPGALIVISGALLVLAAGTFMPSRTRALVLSLATFHAWLELALLAFFSARDGFGPPSGGHAGGRAQGHALVSGKPKRAVPIKPTGL